MKFSLNNRVVLEQYVKEGLKAEFKGGIATPGQRDGVKGLKTLLDFRLPDGTKVPAGSTAYIKEEVLHNHFSTIFKPLTCSSFTSKFMIVELTYVDFIETEDAK